MVALTLMGTGGLGGNAFEVDDEDEAADGAVQVALPWRVRIRGHRDHERANKTVDYQGFFSVATVRAGGGHRGGGGSGVFAGNGFVAVQRGDRGSPLGLR